MLNFSKDLVLRMLLNVYHIEMKRSEAKLLLTSELVSSYAQGH